ncbi:hypothetical protein FMEAI12_2440010 [Parafrankia sp. Ea1.12]|nr:hypothetical protein FMEAI12_2440010 [Parafrankia sp. Ea1.12]
MGLGRRRRRDPAGIRDGLVTSNHGRTLMPGFGRFHRVGSGHCFIPSVAVGRPLPTLWSPR